MSWHNRIDNITAEHISATRRIEDEVAEIDEQARAETTRRVQALSSMYSEVETSEEQAAREARDERDRVSREAVSRGVAARTTRSGRGDTSKDDYVLPSDWTDEDEARAEGYGPPRSWLT